MRKISCTCSVFVIVIILSVGGKQVCPRIGGTHKHSHVCLKITGFGSREVIGCLPYTGMRDAYNNYIYSLDA